MFPKVMPDTTESWQKLQFHYTTIRTEHLRNWFINDPHRFEKFSIKFKEVLFDFSKNIISSETLDLLTKLAAECELPMAIEALFRGEKINQTEDRSVMHMALRKSGTDEVILEGKDVMPAVRKVREQMKKFSEDIVEGRWKGYSHETISDIVNIGIGGSDLGPQMVYEALKPYRKKHIRCHYVSNVDGAHLHETLQGLNPARTLFIIASKTFTTLETMSNAHSARKWFLQSGGESDIPQHFVAVSTNSAKVREFGISEENMFEFWDWTGGRYSLWSAIGLSLCCGLGYDNFEQLLRGAESMDEHFRNSPLQANIPVLMALIGIWYVNFYGAGSEAIIPYSQNLCRFAAYFQQANMESNGKTISRDNKRISYHSGPVIWGEPGTNGQHAFFQLLHQGSRFIPSDFIAAVNSPYDTEHHKKLLANFFAQTEALMRGKTTEEVQNENPGIDETLLPHRVFEGNRPSTSILVPEFNPYYLGLLIAAYEHKIFCQGVIWNIYSFDQWGVELGKQLAVNILDELNGIERVTDHDSSTKGLINHYLQNNSIFDKDAKRKAEI